MKIVFAIEYINKRHAKEGKLRKGGAGRVLVELANELSKRGHEVTIFCLDVNSRDEFMYPILPQIQYHNLLKATSTNFIERSKFKFVTNFINCKWAFYIAVKRLLQNLLQFLGKNQKSNKQFNPFQIKKHSRLTQYISRWNWTLDKILYNYILNSYNLLGQSIKQNNPDVFILFGKLHFFLHTSSRLFTERDFPLIYSVRNSVNAYFMRFIHIPNPYALADFNRILELVDATLVLLPEYIDELPKPFKNKAFSIPNPLNQVDKHKRANPELNTGIKTILAVGRLTLQKNHATLLEAFAKLSPEHPDWQIKIFGDGKLKEELTDQINELKLTDKVFLMGTTDAIHEEYQKAHILAMPSIYEGFPNVLGEAMVYGLPAVGFDNASGVNSLIQHGYNGLLADGNNPVDGLTLCLEQLMTNPELRAELGQNGMETTKLYHPKKIYDLWEKTILEVKHNFNKTSQSL